jgi:diaminopimelate decarboxylase
VTRAAPLRREVRIALSLRDPARGPALVYDLATIADHMYEAMRAAHRHGVRVLFAMKSFPHDEVVRLAAARLDGLDAGSAGEARTAAWSGARLISITDPAGADPAAADLGAVAPGAELRVTCEDAARAAACRHALLAVRLAASHLVPGDDAIGGVLEGSGRRSSRFGVRVGEPGWQGEVRAIMHAGAGRVRGAHVHHGGVAPASPERLVACARAAVAAAAEVELPLAWLNLGGGLHLLPDLEAAFAAVRAVVPSGVEVVVEPGRRFAVDAGVAIGHVRAVRELADRSLRVVDLSRTCHLRWQQVTPGAPPAPTGAARPTLFAGPTCYEDDVVGEWKLDPARYPVGAPLVVAGVNGYALAWNTGFGGVAPADVVVVE